MTTINEKLMAAVKYHQAGQLQTAEQLYREILQIDPHQSDALHLLGTVAAQCGKHDIAADLIGRAVKLNPRSESFHNNLGNSLFQMGDLDRAVACYRQAIELNPNYTDAYSNLGSAYVSLGKLDDAVDCFGRALQLKPDHVDALYNLGNTLQAQRKFEDAARCYQRVVEIRPDHASAHNNLGSIWQVQGSLDRAVACYQRAVRLQPDNADYHVNLGGALQARDKLDEAIGSFKQAALVNPDNVDAHINLANAFNEQGKLDEARSHYERAHEIAPNRPLLELRTATLLPTVFRTNQEIDESRRQFLADVDRVADRHSMLTPEEICAFGVEPPFSLQFFHENIRPLKEAYAHLFANSFSDAVSSARKGTRRIGFVVTSHHERAFLRSMTGVLQHMDPDLFDMAVICSPTGAAKIREQMSSSEIEILPVPAAMDRAVETLRDARFDLLYFWEVGTDATNYFLPFFRLAPVQVTSWGIQVTSGIPQMDYYLSTGLVEPEDAASHYTEQLVLAGTLLTYQYRVSPPAAPKTREDFGFRADQHLYQCAQQLGKFHPDFDAVLAAILRRDESGVIVLIEDRYSSGARKLRRRFAETVPDVAERIVFLPRQSGADYLSLMAAADVLLDPLHFGGVNSTYDGFSLGKPIVTLPSPFHRGRYTYGCYQKMGITDCVASNVEDYVDIAIQLGTDADYREQITERIRERSRVLFEDVEAAREHERIFKELLGQPRAGPRDARTTKQVSRHAVEQPHQGPVFIGGAGRSGTTLLRVMLDSHPNVCCGPELKVLPNIAALYQQLTGPLGSVMRAYGNTRDDVLTHVRTFVEGLVQNIRQSSGKPRWAEKTPHNVLSMASLGEIFPDARFIHVVRDGRDVACSLVTMDWIDPATGRELDYVRNIRNAARYWRRTVETARMQSATPSLSDRVLEVRYESLATETESTMRQILQFIGEPWDDAVLSHHATSPIGGPAESSSHQIRKPVYQSSIGRWQQEMTGQNRADFMTEAGELLEQLGYTWDEQKRLDD